MTVPLLSYSEEDMQKAVATYLDGLATVPGVLEWNHPPNEGKHKPQYYKKQNAMGRKKGEPDCVIYTSNEVIFIELKKKGNYPDSTQKARHEKLRALGWKVYVVTAVSPRDAVNQTENILHAHGVKGAA